MADEYGEKTEEATPRKRQEARDEGKIPKSQELTVAILLLGTALVLFTVIPIVATRLMSMLGASLASAGDLGESLGGEAAIKIGQRMGWQALTVICFVSCSMAVLSLAINAVQARGVLSTKPLAPQIGRINPVTNAKRIFGVQSVIELVKSLVKLVIVGLAIRSVLGAEAIGHIVATVQQSPMALVEVIRHYAVKLVLTAGLSYLALALADYLWQYWRFTKELRMTKEEIKQELKHTEGDVMLKHRRRMIARNRIRKQMFHDVPKADVVIVNPTHRAIALQYDPSKAPAPIVLAMGQRKVAERIKKIAFEHGVPVVENRPLAIALIKHARVGVMIPIELYLAVAEVLAFVIRQRRERGPNWAYRPISYTVGDQV